jgi:hypothetical protein
MSLPVATTISGIDSLAVLRQNLAIVRGFKPMTPEEMQALRERCASFAGEGTWSSTNRPRSTTAGWAVSSTVIRRRNSSRFRDYDTSRSKFLRSTAPQARSSAQNLAARENEHQIRVFPTLQRSTSRVNLELQPAESD